MPTDPVLNDSPWGYWHLGWGGGDSSGNGRDLTVSSGDIGEQEFGYYPPFEGLPGTRGGVVWATGFTPGADWTFRAVVQRNGTIYLLSDGATRLDVASARLTVSPPGSGTWVWGWTPYNIPIIIYLVSSGGTINYWYADYYGWDGIGPVTSGSFSASLSGPLFIGPSGGSSLSMYASVALFDYALSPYRVAVQMSGVEPSLTGQLSDLTDEMVADSPVGLWALPAGDGDEITDETGISGDATLSSGDGFTSGYSSNGGYLFSDSAFSLPVALDSTTFTIGFVYRAGGSDGDMVTVSSGDFSIEVAASYGTTTFSVSAYDTVSWSMSSDDEDHLVSVSRDAAGDLILYVDGIARDTATVSGAVATGASIVESNGPQAYVGTIAVYDDVLDPSRIAAHAAALYPQAMPQIEVDDFDRPDGALGNTSFLGNPWHEIYGSPAITSGAAGGGAAVALGIPNAGGVAAELSRGATTHSSCFIGIGWYDQDTEDGAFSGVVVDWDDQSVYPALLYKDPTYGWGVAGYISGDFTGNASFGTTVEVAVQNDPNGLSMWVDGVPVAAGIDDTIRYGGDWVAFFPTANFGDGTASVNWINALEDIHALGGDPQPEQVGGLEFRFWPFDGVLLGSSTQGPQTGGLIAIPDPGESATVHLGASPNVPQRGGIRTIWTNGPTPTPPTPPAWWNPATPPPNYWNGVGSPPSQLQVNGYPWRVAASCSPALNAEGSGSLTVHPDDAPSLGDELVFTSGGAAVFTGYADVVTTVVTAQGEESEQLVTAQAKDLLSVDWSETVVWPDFGAFEPIRLGAPPQDDREWGWPMNGLVDDENVASLVSSVGNNPDLYGTADEVLPIPDNWPDSTARWMWAGASPDAPSQPQGWCYFRVPFGAWPGKYAVFLNAWDYAKCWIDGALVAEVDTPGQTVRFDVQFDWDYHLIAIAAYNETGPAGVMFSAMQHHADGSGLAQPAMNSRGGWKALAYPERTLYGSTGKVLRTLVREAAARDAPAGGWVCSFTDQADSAGRAWPEGQGQVSTKTGQTYWDVLNMLAEDRIDFHASPSGRVLYAYNKGEGAGSVGIPWTVAVDAESMTTEVAGR